MIKKSTKSLIQGFRQRQRSMGYTKFKGKSPIKAGSRQRLRKSLADTYRTRGKTLIREATVAVEFRSGDLF